MRGLGSRELGHRALGHRALGHRALGHRALGDRALGDRALGHRALGHRDLGGDLGAGLGAGRRELASAASGYVCLVDDAAESFVVGVVVAPDDVPADHAGLFLVTGVVGSVEREVPQRGELRLDAV